MSINRRRSRENNKILYYTNKVNYHLSPHQGVIPEFDLEPENPVGSIIAYTMPFSPKGWLICDGTEVNRNTYVALFSVIGTTFGIGDGNDTFNLPDYRGAFLRGTGQSGTYTQYSGPDANTRQLHATQKHNHDVSSNVVDPGHAHKYQYTTYTETIKIPNITPTINVQDLTVTDQLTDISGTGISVTTTMAPTNISVDVNETRPYNYGVYWLIKY